MSRKPNFDVNVDGRTYGRTEIWTPISHPAISRCDKNDKNQDLQRENLLPFEGFRVGYL